MTDAHAAKPLRKSDILVQELGEQTVLYRTKGKAIHVLNPTARLIWGLCDGQHSLQDMERAVHASFAIPEGYDVCADIRRIVDEFSSKGLMEERL
jgi:hypothetical protein